MKIHFVRTLPPAAAPIPLKDIVRALPACFSDETGDFQFDEEIKQEFGQRYCLLVSSGKAALVLILKALKKLYPERDEVLIPAFTCYSVPAAIKKAGLKIKLCDMGEATLDLDKKHLKKIMEKDHTEKKILCVLITHLFGCPSDFVGIKEIVGDNIPIVEDAAQAMGSEVDNKKIGTQADVGFFSLGRGKALSTMEGGVILSNRPDLGDILAEFLKEIEISSISEKFVLAVKTILANIFQHPNLFCLPKALPFLRLGETIYEEDFPIKQMSSFQKMLGVNWRKRLKRHKEFREVNRIFWQENIPKNLLGMCEGTKHLSVVRFPILVKSVNDRKRILRKSEETGCGIMPPYPTPINKIPQICEEFEGQNFFNAQVLADCLITFPVHEYVDKNDNKRILKITLGCQQPPR